MGENFFLDGEYTKSQIDSLNKIKAKEQPKEKEAVDGDANSIFEDINSYKKDSKAETNNSNLFSYIDTVMGMNDFLNLLDVDGDGKISETEAKKLSGLDSDTKLSSSDIDTFLNSIKSLKTAKSTVDGTSAKTKYEYTTDSTGKLVKKSATKTDNKTNKVTGVYTYNSEGTKIASYENKTKGTTTTYAYNAEGVKTGARVTANNDSKTIKADYTYDTKTGKIATKKEYIMSTTGTKSDCFYTYEYDENGKKSVTKKYRGSSASGKPVSIFKYSYATDDPKDTKPTLRTDTVNGHTKEYNYDPNGKLTSVTFKNKNGKITSTCKCNDDGTYASQTKGDYTTLYEYEKGGIRSAATKYKTSELTQNDVPSRGATVYSQTSYKEGEETEKMVNSNNKTNYYSGGHLRSQVVGEYTYVYNYNSDGSKSSKEKYKTSDCENGTPKSGAKPVGTVEYDEDGKAVEK